MVSLRAEILPVALNPSATWREISAGMECPSTLAQLSPAEQGGLVQLRQGLSNREIATILGKSERTVKYQVSAILAKYGMPTRARLITRLR